MTTNSASSLPETGDILLFSNWSSQAVGIKLTTGSEWNHVGIAVWMRSTDTLKLCTSDKKDGHIISTTQHDPELYCFETNNNSAYDQLSHTDIHGCRLVPFKLLQSRYTYIAFRKLNIKKRDKAFETALWQFINDYIGQPYYQNKIKLVYTALEYPDTTEPETRDTFCSQLVAKYLQRLKLLPADPPAVSYLPRHFNYGDRSKKIPDNVFSSQNIIIYGQAGWSWWWGLVLLVIAICCWLGVRNLKDYVRYTEQERIEA